MLGVIRSTQQQQKAMSVVHTELKERERLRQRDREEIFRFNTRTHSLTPNHGYSINTPAHTPAYSTLPSLPPYTCLDTPPIPRSPLGHPSIPLPSLILHSPNHSPAPPPTLLSPLFHPLHLHPRSLDGQRIMGRSPLAILHTPLHALCAPLHSPERPRQHFRP